MGFPAACEERPKMNQMGHKTIGRKRKRSVVLIFILSCEIMDTLVVYVLLVTF